MKILNLYAGIGGNRKLWGDEHDITAIEQREDIANVYRYYFPRDKVVVGDAHQFLLDHHDEFDFIWSSFPCQSHSRARFARHITTKTIYPDLGLYQEIIFLDSYFSGKWVLENVKPYYAPLIPPTKEIGRHFFWTNFRIGNLTIEETDIENGTRDEWKDFFGFDLSAFKLESRKDQIYRNCVNPEIGLYVLNCALGTIKTKSIQQSLF